MSRSSIIPRGRGAARETSKEFAQFLIVARGSLSELDTQMLIAKNLGYVSEDDVARVQKSVDTVFALIGGLLRSLRQRNGM